jgi:hypothetical protein
MEKTSGRAMHQRSGFAVSPVATCARRLRPVHASRPARAISCATRCTSDSCADRAARLRASTVASHCTPASVTRSVSWPAAERTRSSRPAASRSISSASWQGQPADR